MPHLALMAYSILAIVWSLLGLGFGISEDRFGLYTAIFWTVYNMGMMLIVIRIATRRCAAPFSCRRRPAAV